METISKTQIKIKTWWDMRHERTQVMEIYALICSEAIAYRENAKQERKGSAGRQVQEALSNKLWQIAAALEMTEEINPSK